LCADNDPLTQASLKASLEHYGFNVIRASDSISALDAFKAHQADIDAVVVGNDLNPRGGLELVRAVRENDFQGRIVLIFDNLEIESLRNYQALAISGLFHKPFEPSLLATMLLAD
jgi:DNA-binding NarL/FixJ family response regulator